MSFSVVLENRDFSRMSQPLGTYEVESMKWSCFGGAEKADLIDKSGFTNLQELQGLLRCPVCIYNDLGQAVWWGFVNGIRFGLGNEEVNVSLDELWNRIAVKFRKIGLPYEEEYMSGWAENSKSVGTYGTREKLIIQSKYSADLEAEGIRDRLLAEQSVLERELEQGGLDQGVRLECLGWASTLDWKYQQDTSGFVANDVVMVGVQNVGYLTVEGVSLSKAGQAFVTTGAVDVRRVQIRIRKEGAPTDNVLVSIQTDSSNMPSGTILGQVTLLGSSLSDEGYTWVNFDFATAVSLSANTRYWIVLERSAAVSATNYYVLGMDEASRYMNQSFRNYSGSWVLAKKNMLFRVIGTKETSAQIVDIYNSCNQFLTGIEAKVSSGVHSQVYDRELARGWEKTLGLLEQGTDNGQLMLAEVNRDRKLIVWEQSEKGAQDCYVDAEGQFYDRLNNKMDEGIYPVGEWIRMKASYGAMQSGGNRESPPLLGMGWIWNDRAYPGTGAFYLKELEWQKGRIVYK